MKYQITARSWNAECEKRFGIRDSVLELSDEEVVKAIITFGRAEINELTPVLRVLEFQNDYD